MRFVLVLRSGLLAAAVLVASTIPAAAQNTGSIEGTVLSAVGRTPIGGATV